MASPLFPSGQWVGFYTYSGHTRQFLMDLILEFSNGHMHGEGADGLGFFVIAGRYSEKEREGHWDKTYVARHTVAYCGFREGKGIWGTWDLPGAKGGFHIWPISEGPAPDLRNQKAEEETELVTAVPAPGKFITQSLP